MLSAIENKTIVFGILARDCKASLQRNMIRVEEIGQAFKDYHIVIYENDSKDGTTEMLKEWEVRNDHVIAICETTNQITIPEKSKKSPFPLKSVHRIERMARFRNRLLDEVKKRFEPDYFCFIDIDVESFSPQNVVEAIRQAPSDWGALFASGHYLFGKSDGTEMAPLFQYDSYAFVPAGLDPMTTGAWVVSHHFHDITSWLLDRSLRNCEYLSCRSAFNGIGVYRWNAIRDLKFWIMQTPELKECAACFCEHVPFNGDIVQKGFKLYVAKKIEVTYYHKRLTLMRRFNHWKKALKVRLLVTLSNHPYSHLIEKDLTFAV